VNSSRLFIAPISGGIRTRLLPYSEVFHRGEFGDGWREPDDLAPLFPRSTSWISWSARRLTSRAAREGSARRGPARARGPAAAPDHRPLHRGGRADLWSGRESVANPPQGCRRPSGTRRGVCVRSPAPAPDLLQVHEAGLVTAGVEERVDRRGGGDAGLPHLDDLVHTGEGERMDAAQAVACAASTWVTRACGRGCRAA
jgi:hypothetical protein